MEKNKLPTKSIWNGVVIILTALIISASAIFISLQHSKTQWDIANLQKDAQIEASHNIKGGLGEIGDGLCKTSTRNFVFC